MAAISQTIFADAGIFMNDNFCMLTTISLKFVPKGLMGNNPALVQIIAQRRMGDKP